MTQAWQLAGTCHPLVLGLEPASNLPAYCGVPGGDAGLFFLGMAVTLVGLSGLVLRGIRDEFGHKADV
jgi:hypothetical protein